MRAPSGASNAPKRGKLVEFAVLLPFAGAVFVGLPVLWRGDTADDQGVLTSNASIYLFGVWFVLIILAAILARRFARLDADAS